MHRVGILFGIERLLTRDCLLQFFVRLRQRNSLDPSHRCCVCPQPIFPREAKPYASKRVLPVAHGYKNTYGPQIPENRGYDRPQIQRNTRLPESEFTTTKPPGGS